MGYRYNFRSETAEGKRLTPKLLKRGITKCDLQPVANRTKKVRVKARRRDSDPILTRPKGVF